MSAYPGTNADNPGTIPGQSRTLLVELRHTSDKLYIFPADES